MESKNLGSEIELNNLGCVMEYEVLFDFEISDSTNLFPQNQVINEDRESIECITSKIKSNIVN